MGASTLESSSQDKLIAGVMHRVTESVYPVLSGQGVLARGTVVGLVTASSKLKKIASAAGDGSEAVYGIIAETVDATSADASAVVYLSGQFNQAALVFGTGSTIANTKADARTKGIFYTVVGNNDSVAP